MDLELDPVDEPASEEDELLFVFLDAFLDVNSNPTDLEIGYLAGAVGLEASDLKVVIRAMQSEDLVTEELASPKTQPNTRTVLPSDPVLDADDELKVAFKYDGQTNPDPAPDDINIQFDGEPEELAPKTAQPFAGPDGAPDLSTQ